MPDLNNAFAKGMIIAFWGNEASLPQGWDPCDGTVPGVPNLDGLFLIGTATWNQVTQNAGSATHHHTYSFQTTNMMQGGNGDARAYNVDHQDKPPACTGLDHYHIYHGQTDEQAWIPASKKVMYIMKR